MPWLERAADLAVWSYGAAWLGITLLCLHRLYLAYLYARTRTNAPVRAPLPRIPPRVTVQLPVYNEPLVVDRLIEHVSRLRYPRELLQIQVLDDSTDETTGVARIRVDELRGRGFDVELIHRAQRDGYKAGALQNGLRSATGDFILVLDADFVPPETLLEDMLGQFCAPRVGMVQARWEHINRNYSLLTRVQAILLDGHFVIEQAARNRAGRYFNFNGTAGIWRKECITDAGGWQHDTLTEDLDLSYRAQLRGWKFVFLSDVTVPSELPIEAASFKAQQYRWTKGALQTARKLLPDIWRGHGSLASKLEASVHLLSNLCYFLVLALCLSLLPVILLGPRPAGLPDRLSPLVMDLPIFFLPTLSILVFYGLSQRERGRGWTRTLPWFPFIFTVGIGLAVNNTRAVLGGLLGRQTPFVRTAKFGIRAEDRAGRNKTAGRLRRPGLVPLVELLAGLYFVALTALALWKARFGLVPFLLLFVFGFLYSAWGTVRPPRPDVPLPGRG